MVQIVAPFKESLAFSFCYWGERLIPTKITSDYITDRIWRKVKPCECARACT
uniref:Uncharacterized protein n=1 Tax=Anguilla anguilla TaxID=7936 RepID=A0A0E9W970_ANGAN